MSNDLTAFLANALTTVDANLASDEVLTTEELAQRLNLCKRLISVLAASADAMSEDLAGRMEADDVTLTGVGRLLRKPRYSSTWLDDDARERMYDDAIRAIIQRTCTDPATGEVHQPLAQTAREVWRLTTESFSFVADPKSAFRKTLGLAPDTYRSKRVTGFSVAIEEETL
jgi:hypothetical protein